MRKFCILATIIASTTQPAMALDRQVERQIGAYLAFSTLCQNFSPEEEATEAACVMLQAGHDVLKKKGLCYGKEGQLPFVEGWHECGDRSLQPPDEIRRQPW